MKKIALLFLASCFVVFVSAQDKNAPRLFAIYEHQVKPFMNSKYWDSMKKVRTNSEQHKLNASWTSVRFDDNSFVHLVPIKNFAELDKNMFADLETKMGKESYNAMWADMDQCLETSKSYVASMLPQLSYQTPAADENFRDILFWRVLPGKEQAGEDLLKEWLQLYQTKKVPSGFLTYKIVFGNEPGYAIVSWGKNELDVATKWEKTRELLGEDLGRMWNKTLALTQKIYSKRGDVLTSVSYSGIPSGSN